MSLPVSLSGLLFLLWNLTVSTFWGFGLRKKQVVTARRGSRTGLTTKDEVYTKLKCYAVGNWGDTSSQLLQSIMAKEAENSMRKAAKETNSAQRNDRISAVLGMSSPTRNGQHTAFLWRLKCRLWNGIENSAWNSATPRCYRFRSWRIAYFLYVHFL